MPEILLGPLSIQGNGFFNGIATKIVTSTSPIGSQANIAGKMVLVVKSLTTVTGSAVLAPVPYVVRKYVKANSSSIASASVSSHKFKTVSVSLLTEGFVETYNYDRDVRKSMKNYLPRYYDDLDDVMKMMEVQANEVTRIQAKLAELLDQFYVNSATYGLDRWEAETDIKKIPQRSVDSRRHFINAKLRGVGTVTRGLLNEIVDAFYTSTVTELPVEQQVEIKLLGKRGIPKNLEDIEVAINDVIPAHIEPIYAFTYLPWSEVEQSGLVWAEADTYTHKGLEEAFLIEPPFPYTN